MSGKSRDPRWSFVALVLMSGLMLANCSAWKPWAADDLTSAREALRSGEYAAARASFEAVLRSQPDSEEGRTGLLETLRLTGAYPEAERRSGEFLASRESGGVLLEAGRAAMARGNYEDALRHFRRASSVSGDVRAVASREAGDLLELLGRKSEARQTWEELVRLYRRGVFHDSRDLGSAATAAWRLGYIQDARDIFVDATTESQSGATSPETLVLFADLFLEKYRPSDALSVLRDCLKIAPSYPDALVGVARSKKYESNMEVEASALQALKINPNLVQAMCLLAELRIQEEDYDAALEWLDKALAVNPSDPATLTLKAVYENFRGETGDYAIAERRIMQINPHYAELYHALGENSVMRRKYADAVEFNRRALELDPGLAVASLDLGVNLTRLGNLEEGRRWIQAAFDADGFNIWAFNTLDLLDQMDRFSRSKSPNFVFLMDSEDSGVIAPFSEALAEEAFSKLSRRYGFTPEGPLQVEVFPDHGGFAVRTLGLPGLGALGVCFGKVIAMDSPKARKAGSFNWGSTLWHEFAHVISLQMTRHNIPRWYSEGISVYEERRARPGWGDDLTAEFVRAWKEKKLLKVSELNSGMMRPKFPEQIEFSYYQASLVCELIEERFGFAKIPETLRLFAENRSSQRVFKEALGWDSETLDREYDAFLYQKLGPLAVRLDFKRLEATGEAKSGRPAKSELVQLLQDNPDDFFANLQLGTLLREEKANTDAERYLKKARDLFPEYTGQANPYQQLAEICLESGREDEALEYLLGWTRYDEDSVAPLVRAAGLYRSRKDWKRAADLFELAVYVNPYDPASETGLGEAAIECARWDAALAAWRALLGMNTTDPAGAHYNLARAWLGKGRRTEARREVLRALEIAPTFEKAQELLLKLSGEGQ